MEGVLAATGLACTRIDTTCTGYLAEVNEMLAKAPSQPRQFALVSALRVEC